MKKLVVITLIALLLMVLTSWAVFAQRDPSRGRAFGVGMLYNVNFPASGLSLRLWLTNSIGLEGNIYPLNVPPSFAIRALLKVINASMFDLYLGGGVGFDSNLTADLQISAGLELSPAYNFAFSSEMGYAFLGGSVTAGFAAHYYF